MQGASAWLESQFDAPQNVRTPESSPMTATTAPISAATEQEQHQHDDQNQFHGISPLTAMARMRRGSQQLARGTNVPAPNWSGHFSKRRTRSGA
jgi:hypothetical protein